MDKMQLGGSIYNNKGDDNCIPKFEDVSRTIKISVGKRHIYLEIGPSGRMTIKDQLGRGSFIFTNTDSETIFNMGELFMAAGLRAGYNPLSRMENMLKAMEEEMKVRGIDPNRHLCVRRATANKLKRNVKTSGRNKK